MTLSVVTQNTPTRRQQPSISVRRLPRTNRELPRWEVLSGDEATGWQVIGWIQEEHLRGARNPFFFAIGIHPVDHRHYRLDVLGRDVGDSSWLTRGRTPSGV